MLDKAQASSEAQIRALLDDWVDAVRAKDVERALSHYAANIVLFDLAPPLEYRGSEALKRNLEEWFSSFRSSIGYEIRDLSVTAAKRSPSLGALTTSWGGGPMAKKPMSGFEPRFASRETAGRSG